MFLSSVWKHAHVIIWATFDNNQTDQVDLAISFLKLIHVKSRIPWLIFDHLKCCHVLVDTVRFIFWKMKNWGYIFKRHSSTLKSENDLLPIGSTHKRKKKTFLRVLHGDQRMQLSRHKCWLGTETKTKKTTSEEKVSDAFDRSRKQKKTIKMKQHPNRYTARSTKGALHHISRNRWRYCCANCDPRWCRLSLSESLPAATVAGVVVVFCCSRCFSRRSSSPLGLSSVL